MSKSIILAVSVLMVACAVSSTPPTEPRPERKPEPQPGPGEVGRHCRGYCALVERCEPEHEFGNCPSECNRLLADPELAEVSGFTPEHVRCWSEAQSCALAAACDDTPEGDRE